MRLQPRSLRPVLAACLALAVAAPAFFPAFAFALDATTVSNNVTVAGVSLRGMNQKRARLAIARLTPIPSTPAVEVTGAGKSFSFDTTSAVAIDVDAMLAQALAETTTPSFELTPRYKVKGSVVSAWVSTAAGGIDRAAVSAKRKVVKRRLVVVPEVWGRKVARSGSSSAMRTAVMARLASPSATWTPVALPISKVQPSVRRSNLGKTIIVSLPEFKVLLYNGTKYEKIYGCAIGMRAFPTPTGSFKVIGKSAAPVWHNTGSDWAANMPATIPAGPNNPLGLRALYLNSPGIRIHGTNKYGSIGTRASHGCVRLANPQVVDIYPRVPVGTPVYIVN